MAAGSPPPSGAVLAWGVVEGAYFDHAATTPLRPQATEAMAAVDAGVFGNPSGAHRWARDARRLLDDARDVVADFVGAAPSEVVFTSGGTEADNLAVTGVTAATARRPVCSGVEHHAVLRPVEAAGGEAVAVSPEGTVDLDALAEALRRTPTGLVSVMLANNETGAVNDLAAVAAVVGSVSPDSVLHTDAVAAAAWLDLVPCCAPAAMVTLSAHKLGGPKGVGALIVRRGTPLRAMLLGGGQEHERRAGTPSVAAAVGFAAALRATLAERAATITRVEAMRGRIVDGLRSSVDGVVVVSPDETHRRTAGTILLCIPEVDRESLVLLADRAGIGVSWGSSCSSGAVEPSHVLAAQGVAPGLAAGALRISLGWCTTDEDVEVLLDRLPRIVADLRTGGRR